MVTQRPQTIGSKLVQELNALAHSAEPVDHFTLRRLRREANALLSVDAKDAYAALSAIAAIEGNAVEVRNYAERSLRISPNDPVLLWNISSSFVRAGQPMAALSYIRKAYELNPSNRELSRGYANALINLGQWNDLMMLAESLGVETGEDDGVDALSEVIQYLGEIGVDPARLAKEVAAAHALLGERGFWSPAHMVSKTTDPEDGARSLDFTLVFNGTISEQVQLEAELAKRLSESDDWDPQRLNIGFMTQAMHNEHQARRSS